MVLEGLFRVAADATTKDKSGGKEVAAKLLDPKG